MPHLSPPQADLIAKIDEMLEAANLPSYKDVMDTLVDLDEYSHFDVETDNALIDERLESLKLGARVAVRQYAVSDLGDIDHDPADGGFHLSIRRPGNN